MSAARASDMLIAIWSFCEPEDREAFVSYLHIAGFINSQSAAKPAEAVAEQPQAPQANATATNSNPQKPTSSPVSADKTGAAATSPDTAPVTHSDPLDPGPIPDFLRRTA